MHETWYRHALSMYLWILSGTFTLHARPGLREGDLRGRRRGGGGEEENMATVAPSREGMPKFLLEH